MRRWSVPFVTVFGAGAALWLGAATALAQTAVATPTGGEVTGTESDAPLLVLGIGLLLAIAAGSAYLFFRKPSKDDEDGPDEEALA